MCCAVPLTKPPLPQWFGISLAQKKKGYAISDITY
jgi:hypothetical protein